MHLKQFLLYFRLLRYIGAEYFGLSLKMWGNFICIFIYSILCAFFHFPSYSLCRGWGRSLRAASAEKKVNRGNQRNLPKYLRRKRHEHQIDGGPPGSGRCVLGPPLVTISPLKFSLSSFKSKVERVDTVENSIRVWIY